MHGWTNVVAELFAKPPVMRGVRTSMRACRRSEVSRLCASAPTSAASSTNRAASIIATRNWPARRAPEPAPNRLRQLYIRQCGSHGSGRF